MQINFLFEDVGFYTSITHAHFEELCSDLFCSPLDPVERTLSDAKLAKAQIHELILVVGISKVERRL